MKIGDIEELYDDALIVWGNQDDLPLLRSLARMAYYMDSYSDTYHFKCKFRDATVAQSMNEDVENYRNKKSKLRPILFCRVAKENVAPFQRFPYVKNFLLDYDAQSGSARVCHLLKTVYNNSVVNKICRDNSLSKLKAKNYGYIDAVVQEKAEELYENRNPSLSDCCPGFRDCNRGGYCLDELEGFCRKLARLQLMLHNREEGARAYSLEHFGVALNEVDLLNTERYSLACELAAYIKPIERLLDACRDFLYDDSIEENDELISDMRYLFYSKIK
jgi:hypothetical protein